jgi:hypothetical protein
MADAIAPAYLLAAAALAAATVVARATLRAVPPVAVGSSGGGR